MCWWHHWVNWEIRVWVNNRYSSIYIVIGAINFKLILYVFPGNQLQVMRYLCVVLLLIAVFLAVVCVIVLHWEYLCHYFSLLGTILPPPLQLICRQNGKFRFTMSHRIFACFTHAFLSSLNNILITNALIKQTGRYYLIHYQFLPYIG